MVWNHHFFASTRGRIVLLLRREEHTVDELAQTLKLTDNAVRAHLATLERDGLVSPTSTRRGSSKPAIIYALTPEADRLFPKAYVPVLQQLLDTLSASLPAEKVSEIMEQTGQRLATQWSVTPGASSARVQQAVAILNQLGGLAELEEQGTSYVIQGYSCPFAAIVPNAPEVCHLAQTLLASLIGEPVEEHCERGGTAARCCFTLSKDEEGTSALPGKLLRIPL